MERGGEKNPNGTTASARQDNILFVPLLAHGQTHVCSILAAAAASVLLTLAEVKTSGEKKNVNSQA